MMQVENMVVAQGRNIIVMQVGNIVVAQGENMVVAQGENMVVAQGENMVVELGGGEHGCSMVAPLWYGNTYITSLSLTCNSDAYLSHHF